MLEDQEPAAAAPDESTSPPAVTEKARGAVLVVAIFLAAGAGLVYELIAGTLSSYLLGDSVTQFSLVIGVFLTAMGLGSYLSGRIKKNLVAAFIAVEIAAGLTGGLSSLVAFTAFSLSESYEPVLLACVVLVGTLVGFEIPLVVRILGEIEDLEDALANALAADYLGALAASLLFPFVLLPYFGLIRAGLVVGMVNVLVGIFTLHVFRHELGRRTRKLAWAAAGSLLVLGLALAGSGRLVTWLEARLYQDEVVLAETTGMARLVLTRWRSDVRLYLDGHLQFSSVDEYRYHETLVHPAMGLAERRQRVLILGGGDGLAAREVLKYPEVEAIDLVDIDPRVTDLFRTRPMLTVLNDGALNHPKVRVINADAMTFLRETEGFYDVILIDLPDPSTPSLAKLYSRSMYRLVGHRLAEGGALMTQATSPFRSRDAFWTIKATIEAAEIHTHPERLFLARGLHTVVPTFGTWGFILAAARRPRPEDIQIRVKTRYLSKELLPSLFNFPEDMAERPSPVSRLDDPQVHLRYVEGYHRYLQ